MLFTFVAQHLYVFYCSFSVQWRNLIIERMSINCKLTIVYLASLCDLDPLPPSFLLTNAQPSKRFLCLPSLQLLWKPKVADIIFTRKILSTCFSRLHLLCRLQQLCPHTFWLGECILSDTDNRGRTDIFCLLWPIKRGKGLYCGPPVTLRSWQLYWCLHKALRSNLHFPYLLKHQMLLEITAYRFSLSDRNHVCLPSLSQLGWNALQRRKSGNWKEIKMAAKPNCLIVCSSATQGS